MELDDFELKLRTPLSDEDEEIWQYECGDWENGFYYLHHPSLYSLGRARGSGCKLPTTACTIFLDQRENHIFLRFLGYLVDGGLHEDLHSHAGSRHGMFYIRPEDGKTDEHATTHLLGGR